MQISKIIATGYIYFCLVSLSIISLLFPFRGGYKVVQLGRFLIYKFLYEITIMTILSCVPPNKKEKRHNLN